MPTIILKDNIAVYGPGVVLKAEYADGGKFRDTTTRLDNATQIDIETLPDPFIGGLFAYSDGTLSLIPEREPDYPVPEQVTRLQAFRAIDLSGIEGLPSAFLSWMTDPSRTLTERAFIDSPIWKFDDPTLTATAELFGLTDAQKRALFRLAATL